MKQKKKTKNKTKAYPNLQRILRNETWRLLQRFFVEEMSMYFCHTENTTIGAVSETDIKNT